MADYAQEVIENHGDECGNCGTWRLLTWDTDGSLRMLEECSECGDEEFDIYLAMNDGP